MCSAPWKKKNYFFILFYFIFYKPTVDCGELVRYFPQIVKKEGWITYPSHGNSKTVDTAGDCC
jgi:hypothetical protein